MKKTLLTLAVSTLAASAMAATNTTTTTAGNASKSIFSNTSVSANTSFGFDAIDKSGDRTYDNSTTLSISQKMNNATLTKMKLDIRSKNDDFNGEKSDHVFLNPRLNLYFASTEFETALGKITVSPDGRIEFGTQNDNGVLGTLRAGVTASMNTSASNSVAAWAKTYLNVTDSTATNNGIEIIYLGISDSYAINDANSVYAILEYYGNMNALGNSSKRELILGYANSSIKNLTIEPNFSYIGNKDLNLENITASLDLTYKF